MDQPRLTCRNGNLRNQDALQLQSADQIGWLLSAQRLSGGPEPLPKIVPISGRVSKAPCRLERAAPPTVAPREAYLSRLRTGSFPVLRWTPGLRGVDCGETVDCTKSAG